MKLYYVLNLMWGYICLLKMESGPYTLEIAKRWIRGVMELRGGLDMLQKAIMDLRVIV